MPCFSFYRPRESRGYNGREEGKKKEKYGSRRCAVLLFAWVLLTL